MLDEVYNEVFGLELKGRNNGRQDDLKDMLNDLVLLKRVQVFVYLNHFHLNGERSPANRTIRAKTEDAQVSELERFDQKVILLLRDNFGR